MLVFKYNILKVLDTKIKCSDVSTVQFHIAAVKSPPPKKKFKSRSKIASVTEGK